MKKISYWGLMNPLKAQIVLAFCHLFLAVLAIYSGVLLFSLDIIVPKGFLYFGEALFIGLAIVYPIRRARYRFWKITFAKQKLMNVGLAFSYLFMVITFANTDARLAWHEEETVPSVITTSMKENSRPTTINAPKTSVLSKKELRKQFKTWVTNMKEKSKTGTINEAVGVILLILLTIVLVAALGCTLSCSGTGNIGTFLIAGLLFALIIGCILGIRKIVLRKPNNYQPMPEVE